MIKKLSLCASALLVCASAHAADWDGISIPASAGSGKTWQLQSVSDDFNYSASPTNKPSQFTNRWKDSFINAWKGPGDTEFNPGHSYTTGGSLGLQASAKAGTNKIYAGIISSKQTFTYPLYMEARVKPTNNTMANAVWLLSPDSTQEIDAMESYGSDRPGQEWYDQRMHVSHHVFIRDPFQDYQPKDAGSWVYNGGESYRSGMKRYGVHWKDPWNLDYYIDGVKVRSVSGKAMIDPNDFTNGTGLNKAMHIIIDMEHQDWRDVRPTTAELNDSNKSIFFVDWIRVYKPVNSGGNNGGNDGGNSGGDLTAPSGKTSMKSRSSNRCLDLAAGSSANGANIQQWGCNGNNTNQDFTFQSAGGGYYLVKTKHNKCVDIGGKQTTNGANVLQWNCYNGDNQKFKLVDKSNGWFQLQAKHSNKCLTVQGSSTANGGNIQQWACGNGNNQQFKFQ
ncbi:RICIN domain-containing protein [Agaribacterium sp. ZY112]|uniref:RICIN domain-containing protein n=1 Tax=Agaribacterium sp. ZY112 TaxID=3233574 RepID=UPI003525F810